MVGFCEHKTSFTVQLTFAWAMGVIIPFQLYGGFFEPPYYGLCLMKIIVGRSTKSLFGYGY